MTDPLTDMAADGPCTAELVFSEPADACSLQLLLDSTTA